MKSSVRKKNEYLLRSAHWFWKYYKQIKIFFYKILVQNLYGKYSQSTCVAPCTHITHLIINMMYTIHNSHNTYWYFLRQNRNRKPQFPYTKHVMRTIRTQYRRRQCGENLVLAFFFFTLFHTVPLCTVLSAVTE